MNLKIDSYNKQKILDYQIEIVSSGGSLDTTIILNGSFGHIKLQQIELPHCHVWIASYALLENIRIRGMGQRPVLQLRFPVPPVQEGPEITFDHSRDLSILDLYFSYEQQLCFQLEAPFQKSLIFHVGEGFFTPEQVHMLNYVQQLNPSPNAALSEHSIRLSNPIVYILQQIIRFPLEDAHAPRYLRAKTEELLVHFLKSVESLIASYQALSPGELEKLEKVKQIIQAAPDVYVRDFDLAKSVEMNVFTLRKKFKALTGITIPQFLLKTKMEKAERLLNTTDEPIKAIAFGLGYKNLSNFSETFKKYFGYSPKRVRKKG